MRPAILRVSAATMSFGVTLLLTGVASGAQEDDHAAALALVDQLERDTEHRSVTADALAHARAALERAVRLRAAKIWGHDPDEKHAAQADGLAREWAETARDLVRAVDAEKTAADTRRKAMDAQAQLERTRALVEEGIARVGRLKAAITEAERAPESGRRQAIEVHEGQPPPSTKVAPKVPKKPDSPEPPSP
jgi:hypothetical protein